MRRILAAALATAIAASTAATAAPSSAPPSPLTCSWAAGSDPDAANVAFPDTNATYWLARFTVEPGTRLVINGSYPKARYFSFHVYHPGGVPLDSLYDAQIRPDKGSANPYAGKPAYGTGRRYTVTVAFAAKPAHPAPNTLYAGQTGISTLPNAAGELMLRVYVPTDASSATGGVPLPTVRLETATGQTINAGDACTGKLPQTGAGVNQAITSNNFPTESSAPVATPVPTWGRAYGNPYAGFYGNLQNAYLTATISHEYGNLVVIHAKAPTFPDTRRGVPPYAPAQMRYWSICQNSDSTRVNACAADFQAPLRNGYYTYVISDPSQRPRNATVANGVVWLPWGASDGSATVIYRNMLISKSFHQAAQDVNKGDDPKKVMDRYYPSAVYCTRQRFERGGWASCFSGQ
jgi:hypothetical protein